ncbi:MAG: polysaccharide deacetylase family protein [Clostridia bacterium]|nr:polysaccharide deacetylase family protein [Clostridia bacterium]
MKKVICLVLSLIMTLSCMLPVGVLADTIAEPTLIFDMDLSTYGTDGKIGNAVEGNTSTVSITSSTQSPVLGTTSNRTKYLTFRKTGEQTNSTAVKVQDSAIASSKELTVEAWIRLDGSRGTSDRARLFGLGSNANNTTSHFADFYFVDNNNIYYDVDSQCITPVKNRWARTVRTADNYDNKWTHFVVTRKLTEGATEEESDTCVVTVYINGAAQGEATSYDVDMSTCDSDDKFLIIGAHAGGTGTLWGDIGTFKIYDGIMTGDRAAANYADEYEVFYPPVVDEELIFDMDLSSYSQSSPVVTDSASGDASAITVNGAPVLGREGSQSYLTFRTSADDKTNAVVVSNPALQNLDNATYEAWIRGTAFESNSGNAGRLFALANSGNSPRYIDIYNTLGQLWYRPTGSETNTEQYKKSMSAYDEEWTHVVFTRSWVKDSSGDTGTWYANMYINGVKQLSTDLAISVDARSDESDASLVIGNHYGTFSQGFWGDIADFKVYNYILGSDSISEKYQEGLLLFEDGEIDIEFSSNGSKVEYLDSLNTVNISYSESQTPSMLFAACYDKGGNLLNVEKHEISEAGSVNAEIAYGTNILKVLVWEQDTLKPLKTATEIGYSEGYRAYVFAEGAFYDSEGVEINSIGDRSTISAKVKCTSLEPAGQVYASLVLERNGEEIDSSAVPVNFTDGIADVSVSLENMEALDGDIVTLNVYDSAKVYYKKKIGYSDLSKIVDVLLVAGQSNAMGQGGNATESVKTEPDTVYYQQMGDNTFATTGNAGWASSLGKTWHDETGHTVLVVKAAWGATGFPSLVDGVKLNSDEYGYWNPGNSGSATGSLPRDCYTIAKNYYNAAINSIDTSEYTIGERVYFWNQGENENRQYTAAQYEKAFLEMHNSMLAEFGTEDTRLTCGGILPVRATTSDGVPANLKLTGPRIAQYKMTSEHDDLFLVSDAIEHWYSDISVEDWFADASACPSANMPDSWRAVMNTDELHYTQAAMNELGREAAVNMLTYLSGGRESEGMDFITSGGIRHYSDGDTINLTEDSVIPRLSSASGKKISDISFDGSGAEMTAEGLLAAKPALLNDVTTMTVTVEGQSPMTFTLYSPLEDETITVAPVKDNRSAIYTLTTDDGYAETNIYLNTRLKELGLVATMGLVPANMGDAAGKYLTWEKAEELVNSEGSVWGVANHTQNHKQGYFTNLTETQLDEEIDGGRDTLRSHFPNEKVLALFTPGGASSDLVRSKARENHLMLRIVSGKIHALPMSDEELWRMGGYLVQDTTTGASMNGWVDQAISQGGWLIPLVHGIGTKDAASSSGSGGLNLSTEEAEIHLAYVAQKNNEGVLWVTTLDDAAIYATQRLNSQIKLISDEDGKLVFTLTDDKSVYKVELTLNITLPEGSEVSSVTCGGQEITYTSTDNGLFFNIAPNLGNIEVLYN